MRGEKRGFQLCSVGPTLWKVCAAPQKEVEGGGFGFRGMRSNPLSLVKRIVWGGEVKAPVGERSSTTSNAEGKTGLGRPLFLARWERGGKGKECCERAAA